MSEKILVIDDDSGLLTLLRLGLEREGFTVVVANDGKDGLRKAYESQPDLIILDVMSPKRGGWTTAQRRRNVCDTPIIILTATLAPSEVVKGLYLGADDYITKPCSFDELKARIYAILRRVNPATQKSWRASYDDGILHINFTDGVVKRQGAVINLTPTELRLLMYLVSQKGRVVPHKELLLNVWGPEYADEIGYLSVYIRYLRRKLEDDPENPNYIRTHWGTGYYFSGQGAFQNLGEES